MADEQKPSFESLVERFKSCPCGASAFAVATDMLHFYKEETMALIPKIKGTDLDFDGKTGDGGQSWEMAAALAAAKQQLSPKDSYGFRMRLPDIGILAKAELSEIHAPAQKIYNAAKAETLACGREY